MKNRKAEKTAIDNNDQDFDEIFNKRKESTINNNTIDFKSSQKSLFKST